MRFLAFESGAHLCAGHRSVRVFFFFAVVSLTTSGVYLCNYLALLFCLQFISDAFGASPLRSALNSVEDSYLQLLVPDLINLQFGAKAPTIYRERHSSYHIWSHKATCPVAFSEKLSFT